MTLILNENEPAIVRGIKTVGVGKKGSKNLSPELVAQIKVDLDAGKVSAAAKGAFFAGLIAKGVDPLEAILIPDQKYTIDEIIADAPEFIKWVCYQLIAGHTLDKGTAYDLGRFLFSKDPGHGARGLIASFLRVRYETADEYEGLWQAMQGTIENAFNAVTPLGEPVIQIAEPFDGNDHSYLVTPMVADHVQSQGYRVLHMVGRNSGPKSVYNLYEVAQHLKVSFAQSNTELGQAKPDYGWFYFQRDISSAVDQWVEIRRQTVKRPFLSTLEKFIDPAKADIIVTSAFHPPYGEKMLTIAERAGFKGVMVIRNGIEGSCGMPLKRPAKLLLSARQQDGGYVRHEINFDVEGFLGTSPVKEEQRERLAAEENATLIRSFKRTGNSGDEWFDARVKATKEAFRLGLEYLKENVYGLG